LFISDTPLTDRAFLERLNQSLFFFKIPAISLDDRNTDNNVSIALKKRSDVNAQGTGDMKVYSPLLNQLKVHEFATALSGLPDISVNLQHLQHYGYSDEAVLMLSPDHFLRSDSVLTKTNQGEGK